MLLNRGNRGWVIACSILLVIATVVYIPYAMHSPHGPSGGSTLGLIYGIAGTAMMVFAILLAVRKRLRWARLGRTYHWLQGHVWLGMLSYPIVLFHAGFRFNGSAMGMALMVLFAICFISGIVGLIAQQILPNKMLREVPGESIYEQIPHLLDQLRCEANEQMQLLRRTDEITAKAVEGGGVATLTRSTSLVGAGIVEIETLYRESIEPFLADRLPRRTPFTSVESTNDQFRRIRRRIDAELEEPLDALQSIVNDRRQLERQRRLYQLLHSWLLVHVPVSYGLMLLVAVHIVVALRYGVSSR